MKDASPIKGRVGEVAKETKRQKKPSPRLFRPNHSQLWGIQVIKRDPDTQQVRAVECMFCLKFGREQKVNGKPLKNVKRWEGPPFRTDSFKHHMLSSHPKRFAEYRCCENQSTFFDNVNEPFDNIGNSSRDGCDIAPPQLSTSNPLPQIMNTSAALMTSSPPSLPKQYQPPPTQALYQPSSSTQASTGFHTLHQQDMYTSQHPTTMATPRGMAPSHSNVASRMIDNILVVLDALKQAGYAYELILEDPPPDQNCDWQGFPQTAKPGGNRRVFSSHPHASIEDHVLHQAPPQPIIYNQGTPQNQHRYTQQHHQPSQQSGSSHQLLPAQQNQHQLQYTSGTPPTSAGTRRRNDSAGGLLVPDIVSATDGET